MKRIGLIGGLSPESTVHYYQILCREFNRQFGGLNFPEISLESLNLQQLIKLFERNDWDGVAAILGCTELGLLIKNEDTALPLYDTTRIHAEAILDHALGRLPGSKIGESGESE